MNALAGLGSNRLVAIDTPVFIYAWEGHPTFAPIADRILGDVLDGALSAVSSTLLLAEMLVQPYGLGRDDLARAYSERLVRYPNLRLVQPDVPVCRLAAELRARHPRLKLMDAVHLATAVAAGATAFVTNDRDLPTGLPIRVLQLSDLASDTEARS